MEIEIQERVDGESTSIPIKDEPTVEGLRKQLRSHSPLLPSCCIFRVPEVIRRQKKEAYEPNIISVGPIHRRDPEKKFKFFEDVKRWYLHCLLSLSTDISLELERLIKEITRLSKSTRDCYAYPLDDLNQKDFVEMMILDGCFLLELFRRELFGEPQEVYDDPVFNVSCTREHLSHDLLLLENQLPWSVLECLYNLTANFPSQQASLTYLVLNFFRQSPADELMLNHSFRLPCKIFHILDLVRTVMVNGFEEKLDEDVKKKRKKNELNLPQRIPNATSLSKAGIQFRSSQRKGECIMNIEFNKNGVFTIPLLAIDERTEPLFRNLIAFEQCHHNRLHKITSYAVLLDNLIDSREDVDFLCDKEILANWLNTDDAAQFFNKLYNDTTVEYYYSALSDKVNDYYRSKWHMFMEILRSDYFSTPWRIISFIAAFILLVLTLVQTLYAIQWP